MAAESNIRRGGELDVPPVLERRSEEGCSDPELMSTYTLRCAFVLGYLNLCEVSCLSVPGDDMSRSTEAVGRWLLNADAYTEGDSWAMNGKLPIDSFCWHRLLPFDAAAPVMREQHQLALTDSIDQYILIEDRAAKLPLKAIRITHICLNSAVTNPARLLSSLDLVA